jgi:type IV pilus assembly protein PilV
MHRAAGVSLVEVLVSIVILSIGLLGTAGLMGNSLKSTTNSYYRSQATILADDLMDRMRANQDDARAGRFDADLGDPASSCSGNAGTMALVDCTEWKEMIAGTFPGGDATVDVDANGVATIVIQWNDATESFTTKSRL